MITQLIANEIHHLVYYSHDATRMIHMQYGIERTLQFISPRKNCRHFADNIRKRIFLTESVRIAMQISLKFVPKGPFGNMSALFQVIAWRRTGAKPLPEPILTKLTMPYYGGNELTHWLLGNVVILVLSPNTCYGSSCGIALIWMSAVISQLWFK